MKTITKKVVANICATSQLFYPYVVRIIASFTIILTGLTLAATWSIAAEPPMPTLFSPMGKQHPYITIVSCLHTQVVTQVYEVRYLRTIALMNVESNLLETNFVALRTNAPVAVLTNSVSFGNPP